MPVRNEIKSVVKWVDSLPETTPLEDMYEVYDGTLYLRFDIGDDLLLCRWYDEDNNRNVYLGVYDKNPSRATLHRIDITSREERELDRAISRFVSRVSRRDEIRDKRIVDDLLKNAIVPNCR